MLGPFFTTSVHLSKVIPSFISCYSFLFDDQECGVGSALHPVTPQRDVSSCWDELVCSKAASTAGEELLGMLFMVPAPL